MKSDQEPSIVALRDRVKCESDISIVNEYSPVGESSSNGDIEEAIKRSTALTRVLKSSIESHTNASIQADWSIVPCIVLHSSNIISWFQRDDDGRTPYEKLHGKTFNRRLVPIGESYLLCTLSKT